MWKYQAKIYPGLDLGHTVCDFIVSLLFCKVMFISYLESLSRTIPDMMKHSNHRTI